MTIMTTLPKLDRPSGDARKAPPAERFRELPLREAPSTLRPDLLSESSAGMPRRLLAVPSITPSCKYFFVDIDGTLAEYRAGAMNSLLHGNFLFPIIRELMREAGWDGEKAEEAILNYSQTNIFWDYTDFIAEFRLPVCEAFRRFRQWHRDNILPCGDGVSLVKRLHSEGKKLFIMSNNPYSGCLLKLQAAGLADNDFQSPYFERILGTNIVRGCKCFPEVWERACACIPVPKSEICVIGDNPKDDRDIPASCGITNSIILERDKTIRGIDINK